MSKMLTLAAAFAGAVSLMGATAPAFAADEAAAQVKCYGVAKAGENSCANAAGTHSCAGHATANYDGGDFKVVASKEACDALKGKTEAFTGTNADMKAE